MTLFLRWKEIIQYRELLLNLIKKDIKIKYKNSILGFFWSLLNPIMMLFVYTIAFNIILRIKIENFPLFLFTGLVPWIFFHGSLTASASSIFTNANLVKKVYFPREIIPLSVVGANLFNFIMTMVIVFIVLLLYGIPVYSKIYLLIPIIVLHLLLTAGLSLIFSAITVKYRDVGHLLEVFLSALFYLTPIIYPLDMIPEQYKTWIILNPLTAIITLYRRVLFETTLPSLDLWLIAAIVALFSIVIGHLVFNRLSPSFGDNL